MWDVGIYWLVLNHWLLYIMRFLCLKYMEKSKSFLMNAIQRMLKTVKKTFYAFYCHSLLIMDQTFMCLYSPRMT